VRRLYAELTLKISPHRRAVLLRDRCGECPRRVA
jgi:hypothetical protein